MMYNKDQFQSFFFFYLFMRFGNLLAVVAVLTQLRHFLPCILFSDYVDTGNTLWNIMLNSTKYFFKETNSFMISL